jgi:hypothetical protein
MTKNKELMFQVSIAMPKAEALSFGKTMPQGDKYYVYKTKENPKARDAFRRESWVLVRDLRKGEIVANGSGLFAEKERLLNVL